MSARLWLPVALAAPVLAAAVVSALAGSDETTAAGSVATVSSCRQITTSSLFSGDADGDGSTAVEVNTVDAWPGATACAAVVGSSPRQCLVNALAPASSYFVRVTHSDPDGVAGANPEVLGPLAVPACGSDQAAPTVLVQSPGRDAVVGGGEAIKVQVFDAGGLAAGAPVQVAVDGGAFTAAALGAHYGCGVGCEVWELALDAAALADGGHYLSVLATDAAGNVARVDRPFEVRSAGASPAGSGTLLRRTAGPRLCRDCHNLASHSSQATGTKYGNWALGCLDCHTPHRTRNIHLVRESIATPSSGRATVVFRQDDIAGGTNPQWSYLGDASGADNVPWNDGICEVCHTRTSHYRNDASGGDHSHNQAARCVRCHPHERGFQGGGSGAAHDSHLIEPWGPRMTCGAGDLGCHGSQPPPLLADGLDLAATTVCDGCHSPGGAYDGVVSTTGSVGAKDNWPDGVYDGGVLAAGKEKWCAGCHDDVPAEVGGETAANKAGDDTTYGYYVTGHGRESAFARMSWQATASAGNPAAAQPCTSCHLYTAEHISTTASSSRLRAGFEIDQANTGCGNCHQPGSAAVGAPQFYTDSASYETSAHGSTLCSDCHDVHGTAGPFPAMTLAGQETLCYGCHTEGMVQNDALANNRPGGYVSADDVEEAFAKSRKHDLGAAFSVGGGDYTLECVSCHNVHLVTGKYWDALEVKSPVTRFTANTEVWGDEAGEKMDDFAARASGTGGWYYSVARGRVAVSDQPAKYQPPKAGNGWDQEYPGDVVPDYTTFCLDCHSSQTSGSVGPINWGQGIGCGWPEPPGPGYVNWVTCSSPHGLALAARPSYWGDVGMYGSSGNPDPIFSEPGVTRGRGAGHFMRWPYDSVHKNAGVNFVMSCTDCHEAHGSNRGGMIRERFNVNANGDCGTGGNPAPDGENCSDGGNWNSFCNACHYYYGGQHAGMSCGNASCHEVNSIHRIKKNTGGGGPWLWTEPSRPSTTPEIAAASGDVGSFEMLVTFTQGVWTERDVTGALASDDFLLTDAGGDNPRTITGVTHTAGDAAATITMSAPLIEADLDTDLLATRGISAWDSGGDPAGPWTLPVAGTFVITEVKGVDTGIELYVTFSESATANSDGTGGLEPGDFLLTDAGGDNPRSIVGVTHTAGDDDAILLLDAPHVTADFGADTLAAAAGAIYQSAGYVMATGPAVPITEFTDVQILTPMIFWTGGFDGSSKVYVRFYGHAYAERNGTGDLQPGDFVLTDAGGDNPRSITAVAHTAGDREAVLTLDAVNGAADLGVDTVAAAATSIFSRGGFAFGIAEVVISAIRAPEIIGVEGYAGGTRLLVTFADFAFSNTGGSGAVAAGDLVLTDAGGDNPRSISGVTHTAGDTNAMVTMDQPLIAADLGSDTLAAAAGEIWNDIDYPFSTTPVAITVRTAPAITAASGAVGYDQLLVSFDQGVYSDVSQTGALVATDFVLTDVDDSRTIDSVQHVAGQANAVLTLSSALDGTGDAGVDTLAAAAGEIYNNVDGPAGTAAVTIAGNDCPPAGAAFHLDEAQAAATTADESGLLVGTVSNPAFVFPDPVNTAFHGDENEGTRIDVDNNAACLMSNRALTVEARIQPNAVDLDFADADGDGVDDNLGRTATFGRIFERRRNLMITLLHTWYRGDGISEQAGKGAIEVKYRTDASVRHTCPHPSYPNDTYAGNDVRMHQISSEAAVHPIVNDHWYRIRVVFNSDKPNFPVDIFADDQGTDGVAEPLAGAGELWSGFKNIARTEPEDGCKWGALPGDFIETRDEFTYLGSPWSSSNATHLFKGLIDWVTWSPIADYTGVDDPPH